MKDYLSNIASLGGGALPGGGPGFATTLEERGDQEITGRLPVGWRKLAGGGDPFTCSTWHNSTFCHPAHDTTTASRSGPCTNRA